MHELARPTKVRKKYLLQKRHAGVRALPIIAGKHNPNHSIKAEAIARSEVPPCDVAAGAIEIQLSPPKRAAPRQEISGLHSGTMSDEWASE